MKEMQKVGAIDVNNEMNLTPLKKNSASSCITVVLKFCATMMVHKGH